MTDPMIPDRPQDKTDRLVRHFRQIMVWPVQLMPLRDHGPIETHWEKLAGADCPWSVLDDEFTEDCNAFHERHYVEFVAFLPHVQRFIYGEGRTVGDHGGYGASPIRVYRRKDVARARVQSRADGPVIDFEVIHVDLCFFYDVDVAFLVVEFAADDIPLADAEDTLFRLSRTYPTFWNDDGSAVYCCHKVEWLDAAGGVLAASDFQDRRRYLDFTCINRAPYIAAHWRFLMHPLALHHSDEKGAIRFRQLEYQRMPVMSYVALDDPAVLQRSDWMRLGLGTAPGPSGQLPFSRRFMANFETRFCLDRHWGDAGDHDGTPLRIVCSHHALTMVGQAGDAYFSDAETGMLSQFRHQYFMIALIAHLHRASLLMFSDRLVTAISHLDVGDVESVKKFKREIRGIRENFLRFNHRYWFHEVSNQPLMRDVFRQLREQLEIDRLFAEVRGEVEDMSNYLDSDSVRRQSNSVLRLTVVTIFGLVGTLATGFLGMNLIAAADQPLWLQIVYFMAVFMPTVWLIAYTIMKSRKLSDFVELLSDERIPLRHKLRGVRPK